MERTLSPLTGTDDHMAISSRKFRAVSLHFSNSSGSYATTALPNPHFPWNLQVRGALTIARPKELPEAYTSRFPRRYLDDTEEAES